MAKVIRAAVIVFPGVEELDFAGVWEVLGTTQHLSKEAYFQLRSVGTVAGAIECAHGLTIMAGEMLEDLSGYDVVIVPGGPGTSGAMENETLLKQIKQVYEAGKLVCSVCTGALILGEAGVLNGKKATTYHTLINELSKYGAIPIKQRVVVEGNVITGAGVTASMDVGLKIVEIFMGQETAAKVAEWIEYSY